MTGVPWHLTRNRQFEQVQVRAATRVLPVIDEHKAGATPSLLESIQIENSTLLRIA
jgi:hypothetical protein